MFRKLPIDFTEFDRQCQQGQKQLSSAIEHEVRMYQLTHKKCHKCQGVSLVKEYHRVRGYMTEYHCNDCRKHDTSYYWKYGYDAMLPVWYNSNGQVEFHIPPELKDLRLGEQLLIQRLSCYIPVVHIKNGIMGLHGNCVCFRQNNIEICNVLPRTRANAIKIVRSYETTNKNTVKDIDIFVIRRKVVLQALYWLKMYHKWYREDPDLLIDETNLSWMGNEEEANLIGTNATTSNMMDCTEFDSLLHEEDEKNQNGRMADYYADLLQNV